MKPTALTEKRLQTPLIRQAKIRNTQMMLNLAGTEPETEDKHSLQR